jgi:DNA-binding MarR family transcriptional regulator
MSRSHPPYPSHSHASYSHSPHPNRSTPEMPEQHNDRHDCPLPPLPPEGGSREPTAVDLAEALLGTAHAFKQWGNLCYSQAEPGLRELSVPRARLLAALADAGQGSVQMPAGTQRGRGRREVPLTDGEQGRVRMGDLAQALGVTARNVTTIVDGLEREGLLARRPDPTDRRAILLELTEKGWAHVEQVHALQRSLAERMFAPLSSEESRTLYALLTRLAGRVLHAAETGANGRDEETADQGR